MLRFPIEQRANWQQMARDYGFHFHTMHGQAYWDESAYYQFTLEQIERDLESPTEELHQMCLHIVDKVSKNDELLTLFAIPEHYWQGIADSWQAQEPSLYSRLDFVYDGKSPAKLLENNADTPTSLYESGFWQWLWLESNVDNNKLSKAADQFNSLQEKLVNQFKVIAHYYGLQHMHFSCCKDTEEDRGTVQYLQDCAKEAGIDDYFVFVEDIGLGQGGELTDLQDQVISHCFKLYPWEFMQREEFGPYALSSNTAWLEPIWKSILSNKALLPALWKEFEGHPNLLPAFFESDLHKMNTISGVDKWVKKPIFSREGANIDILENGRMKLSSDGPYGEEGFVYQAFTPLPKFGESYTLIGSWLVNEQAAGISIREDESPITQDMSRYLPHIIL
ncbi:glutathionylspermidine synthase family protein [Glaciecola sp. MH2013]|uniref:glutathionylspermidine synthase family protein n=1 Tax=Glaciecola sp. MH2013 TaxID=2785524 RepID=UPI0018A0E6EE|nr:glutathionylspermidine synthase family protein [Glaciecola sp. MH2013]MBF7074817.1 glutathionylspermidine synthase family protein [Glaciecola sp. MH2013]